MKGKREDELGKWSSRDCGRDYRRASMELFNEVIDSHAAFEHTIVGETKLDFPTSEI